jgi:hypothetical protein
MAYLRQLRSGPVVLFTLLALGSAARTAEAQSVCATGSAAGDSCDGGTCLGATCSFETTTGPSANEACVLCVALTAGECVQGANCPQGCVAHVDVGSATPLDAALVEAGTLLGYGFSIGQCSPVDASDAAIAGDAGGGTTSDATAASGDASATPLDAGATATGLDAAVVPTATVAKGCSCRAGGLPNDGGSGFAGFAGLGFATLALLGFRRRAARTT